MASPYPVSVELAANGFAAHETPANEMPGTVTTVPIKPTTAPDCFRVSSGNALQGRNWVDVQVLVVAGEDFSSAPPARIVTQESGVPALWDDTHSLPVSRESRLRFGIHGAARLFGFSFRDSDGRR